MAGTMLKVMCILNFVISKGRKLNVTNLIFYNHAKVTLEGALSKIDPIINWINRKRQMSEIFLFYKLTITSGWNMFYLDFLD